MKYRDINKRSGSLIHKRCSINLLISGRIYVLNLFLVLTVLFFMPSQSYSQITRNTIITGGSFSFFSEKRDRTTLSTFYTDRLILSTEIIAGYFIINNLSMNLNPVFSYTKKKYPENPGYLITNEYEYGLAPEITYYFLKNRLLPFVRLGSEFLLYQKKSRHYRDEPIPTQKNTGERYNIIAGGGILYRINKNIAIDITFQQAWRYFHRENSSYGFENKHKGVDIAIGFKIFLFSK